MVFQEPVDSKAFFFDHETSQDEDCHQGSWEQTQQPDTAVGASSSAFSSAKEQVLESG